ncbi:subtilisin-like serine endopeptidase family protein [Striga asiatica]|uniref:Subtilisin-like serine endopeptidase family protein n=1 Tax=Striga asiatica TaxID=4170 RepID=A0A5A7QEV6_STRAF|nr:subtilisin-like serine endopeptidase family protein [Striga asiatica]
MHLVFRKPVIMKLSYLFFVFNLLVIVSFLAEADNLAKSNHDRVYVVYMGKIISQNGDPRSDHTDILIELNTRKKNSVVHIYNRSFLGFAARLSEKEAKSISEREGVVSVFPDRPKLQLHTTRSWDFLWRLNAFKNNNSTLPASPPSVTNMSAGAHDSIIGVIDGGIWPEHSSFDDKYMDPIPRRWKGECMPGENSFLCNRKVIGARYYDDTEDPGYIMTARDEDGHGTHVASIAAGVPVWGASYYGLAEGIARGGSPSSRLAVYRACGSDECLPSGILKAFDDAIGDGVDVISVSLGYKYDSFLVDPNAVGAFHAVERGITVVCSTGNGGPAPGTLKNVAPWILSVGASTIDRVFQVRIVLGRKMVIKGGGISILDPKKCANKMFPLIDGLSASNTTNTFYARNCIPGSLDDAKVKGKIILCGSAGPSGLDDRIITLKEQGAIGVILINYLIGQATHSYGTILFVAVNLEDGAQIQTYINSTCNPVAKILPTDAILDYKPAPVIPFFSSRGPIDGIKNLLKPDVTAPGVGIVAAWPPLNYTDEYIPSKGPPKFNILSGTSMSCPHVSGLAALVKSYHPNWTPSAIKSAIMTTATQTNNLHTPITTHSGSRATPYDFGAGEINPFASLSPGLVFKTETIDYVLFLCNLGYNESTIKVIASTVPRNFRCPDNSNPDLVSDMNYPSIAVSGLNANRMRIVKRTVTNVGELYSKYTATVVAPPGVQVQVKPNKLHFTKKVEKLSFQITFTGISDFREPLFGSISWSNWKYTVQIPFVAIN